MEDKATQTPVQVVETTDGNPSKPEPTPQAAAPAQAEATPSSGNLMEQALQDAEARLEKTVQRGQILQGTVVFVGQDGVAVDIGARTEGIIPFNQLTEEALSEEELKKLLKPGDQVTVYVVRADLENGQIILSKKRAETDRSWVKIQELFDRGEPVMVTVKEKVKGVWWPSSRVFAPSCRPLR